MGNDGYSEVPQLQRAVADAWAVGDTFQLLGFEVQRHANLRRRDFSVSLAEFVKTLNDGDEAAFFYAGHGVAISGENYLLPTDIPNEGPGGETFIRNEAFGLSDILDSIQSRNVRLSIIILDACRNNPFRKEGARSLGTTRGLQPVVPPQGTFILYSAGVGQQALDSLGDADTNQNSVFVRNLIPLMRTPGMSLPILAREVRKQVTELAATLSHEQRPAYYDEVVGDVYLAGLPTGNDNSTQPQTQIEAKPTEPTLPRALPWNRQFDEVRLVEFSSLAVTRDGKLVATGDVFGNNGGYLDLHSGFVRFNRSGKVEVTRVHELEKDNILTSMKSLSDGTLAAVGRMEPQNMTSAQMWFVRLSDDGDILSSFDAGNPNDFELAMDFTENESGNIVMAGLQRPEGSIAQGGIVIATDPQGNVLWRQTFIDHGEASAESVDAIPGGDVIVAGDANGRQPGAPSTGIWLARIRPNGEVVWRQSYDFARSVAQVIHNSAGSLNVVGTVKSKTDGSDDIVVAKLSLDGALLSSTTFGSDGTEVATAMLEGPDRLIVAGSTTSKGGGGSDAWLLGVRTAHEIGLSENRTFGTVGDDKPLALAMLPDGSVAVGGWRNGGGNWAFLLAEELEIPNDSFTGDCLKETQWTAYKAEENSGWFHAGVQYCEAEEAEPHLWLSCGLESQTFSLIADLDIPEKYNERPFRASIAIDGKRFDFDGATQFNEMAGTNALIGELPFDSPIPDALANGTSAVIKAGGESLTIHLRGSRQAIDILKLCSSYQAAVLR
ncbi:MAG: caspase family protein [Rhizobiaceae bacterium]